MVARTIKRLGPAQIIMMSLVALAIPSLSGEEAVPAATFHHVHLNVADPTVSVAFYTKTFEDTHEESVAGWKAVKAENIHLLFARTTGVPAAGPQTAIWHFGWTTSDVAGDHAKYAGRGVKVAESQPGVFAFLVAPDGNIIEINRGATRRFSHVHLYSDDPICAALWYQNYLGATVVSPTSQPSASNCHVAYGPVGDFGWTRTPQATVKFGDINVLIFPNQHRPSGFQSSRGHVLDHIAVSYPDVRSALNRLKKRRVRVLADVHNWGDTTTKAAMVQGPDSLAIELVEPVAP